MLPDTNLFIVHDPRPEYELDKSDPYTREYIPMRWAWLLSRGRGMIALPKSTEMFEWWGFVKRFFDLHFNQVFFTSGETFTMCAELKEKASDVERQLGSVSHGNWSLFPYASHSDSTSVLAKRLEMKVIGDHPEWVKRHHDKGILHPTPSGITREEGLPLLAGVPLCKGYTCRADGAEIEVAYRALKKSGVKRVIAKARSASAGEGFVSDFEPDMLTEKLLALWTTYSGVVLEEMRAHFSAGSLQFVGEKVFEQPTRQLTAGNVYRGNEVPDVFRPEARQEIIRATKKVLSQVKPQGPGALDFLVEDERVFLVDPNLGRTTGGMVGRFFHQKYAPHLCYRAWKVSTPLPDDVSVEVFYQRLVARGMAFNPHSPDRGVFPLGYLRGKWYMLIAFGEDESDFSFLDSVCTEAEVEKLLRA